MLLTVLMAVGATSAWADTYVNETYSAESTADGWKTSVDGRFNPVILNDGDDYYLSVNQDQRLNNGATVTGTILAGKVAAGKDFTLTFDLKLASSNDQTPASLAIKDAENAADIFSLTATGKSVDTWLVNGSQDLKITLPGSKPNGLSAITWISVQVTRKGEVTMATITNRETSEVILPQTIVEASTKGGVGNVVFTTRRYNANFAIDNITLRDWQTGDSPDKAATHYTIKYQDSEGNTLKEDQKATAFVGDEVTASPAQTAAFLKDADKWLYTEGNATITLQEDETQNVITLTFKKAATYSYTIQAFDNYGHQLALLASSTGYEQDAVKATWPHYIAKDGQLYEKSAVNSNYYENISLTEDGQTIIFHYDANVTFGAVFATEGENISGASVVNTGNAEARSSNAASGYATDEDLKLVTLPAGSYQIFTGCYFPTSTEHTVAITNGTDTIQAITAKSTNLKTDDTTFTLEAETTLYLAKGGSANAALDYLYIVDTNAAKPTFVACIDGYDYNFRIISEEEKTVELFRNPDFISGLAVDERKDAPILPFDITLPAEVTNPDNSETYRLVGVGDRAFELLYDHATLTLPEGVTYIGTRGFYNNSWNKVILPSTLTAMGDAAFGKSWNMHEMKSGAKEPAKNTVARAYSTAQMPGSILRVPVGTTAAYEANGYLNFFETLEEYQPNGYVFTATTEQGLDMKFRIVDENEKTVEAYGTYDGGPAISNKTEGELIIPAEIEGYRVVGISSWAFRNCQQLTSVSIPVGITYIGESAFRTCYALASANIPEGVTTIGSHAFFDCKLNFIDLPSTLTEMGDRAFRNTDVKGEETEKADEAVPYIVIANMPEPIVLDDNIYIYYPEHQDLYVPKGSKELYKAATMWKSFRNIYELGEEINTEHLALKAADIKVKAGEETTLNINLNTTVSTYRGYQFKLMLPEGVTITTDEKGKLNMKSAYTNEYMSVRGALQGDGSYIISSNTTEGAVASSGNGLMLSLTVSADKTMTAGTYNGSIEDIVFATEDNKSDKPASSTFTVTLEADEPVEQAPVYTENVEGNAGVEITMPVGLNNSTSIAGFVFQLTLPKGFTVPTDGSGKLQAELVGDYESIPVAVAKDPSGTNVYNFYAFGLDNSTFKAKAGHVLDVKVNIPADMPSGDYAVKTKTLNFNLIDSEGSDEARSISNLAKAARKAGAEQNVTSYSTITVKGGTTTLGDVNNDNIVNVTDVTMTISYILGQNPAGFNTTTADVDNSGKIDITDVTTIIDMILKSK